MTSKPTPKPKYPANGRYLVLRAISHPEAKHVDGTIRPERDGEVFVSMAHRANDPAAIELLVDTVKAIQLVPAEKPAK